MKAVWGMRHGIRKSRSSSGFCKKRERALGEVCGDELRHLEHVDAFAAAEDFLEVRIRIDLPLILRILKILRLDVHPELLRHFRTGHRSFPDNCREVSADTERLHKCCIRFRHTTIVIFVITVPLRYKIGLACQPSAAHPLCRSVPEELCADACFCLISSRMHEGTSLPS